MIYLCIEPIIMDQSGQNRKPWFKQLFMPNGEPENVHLLQTNTSLECFDISGDQEEGRGSKEKEKRNHTRSDGEP